MGGKNSGVYGFIDCRRSDRADRSGAVSRDGDGWKYPQPCGERERQRAEIIYIRHDSGKTGFTAGCTGHEIHKALAPKDGERIFDKRFNSAFLDTGLHGHLQDKGIKNIILTGLRTEYCIDATCKAAFERDYMVYVPKWAHTTFDNGPFSAAQLIAFYEERIWNNRFAKVLSHDGLKSILYP